MTKTDLLNRLAEGRLITAPGIFDMVSALVADRMGFEALFATGYGTVASGYGLPDAGLATYSDMLERFARMAALTRTPVIADADTGFGGLVNMRHTVRGYEAAGIAAIQIEDQEFPKRCGHTGPRPVIDGDEMARKIEVAASSRRCDGFAVIARTDARLSLGLDAALERARLYQTAGADVIFIEALKSRDEIARAVDLLDRPLAVNMAVGGKTPAMARRVLTELGVALAIYPTQALLAATAAMETTFAALKATGETDGERLYDFSAFNTLVGMDEIQAFESRFAEPGGVGSIVRQP